MKKKILRIHAFEAAVTKRMFLLGQYDAPELIMASLQKSLAGELTVLQ